MAHRRAMQQDRAGVFAGTRDAGEGCLNRRAPTALIGLNQLRFGRAVILAADVFNQLLCLFKICRALIITNLYDAPLMEAIIGHDIRLLRRTGGQTE